MVQYSFMGSPTVDVGPTPSTHFNAATAQEMVALANDTSALCYTSSRRHRRQVLAQFCVK